MSRNTLFARLKEAANDDGIDKPDRIAAAYVASDPVYIASFDAWLAGPWEAVKDKFHHKEIALAAGRFMDGWKSETAWDEYRAIHIDPYRDDEKPDCCGDAGDCDDDC
jgi:hypothetical protein